ncbi:unnamed protein product [Amoebophrya sp. A120]|nr:unnamed protein product [Amoebophrya sp. A120]|eukprot:GSA120T00018643001.1
MKRIFEPRPPLPTLVEGAELPVSDEVNIDCEQENKDEDVKNLRDLQSVVTRGTETATRLAGAVLQSLPSVAEENYFAVASEADLEEDKKKLVEAAQKKLAYWHETGMGKIWAPASDSDGQRGRGEAQEELRAAAKKKDEKVVRGSFTTPEDAGQTGNGGRGAEKTTFDTGSGLHDAAATFEVEVFDRRTVVPQMKVENDAHSSTENLGEELVDRRTRSCRRIKALHDPVDENNVHQLLLTTPDPVPSLSSPSSTPDMEVKASASKSTISQIYCAKSMTDAGYYRADHRQQLLELDGASSRKFNLRREINNGGVASVYPETGVFATTSQHYNSEDHQTVRDGSLIRLPRSASTSRALGRPTTSAARTFVSLRDRAEKDLEFLGLILFRNELKPESPMAIRWLKANGVHCVMITGDAVWTGVSVGRKCGFVEDNEERVFVGDIVAGIAGRGEQEHVLWEEDVVACGTTSDDAPASASSLAPPPTTRTKKLSTVEMISLLRRSEDREHVGAEKMEKKIVLAVTEAAYNVLVTSSGCPETELEDDETSRCDVTESDALHPAGTTRTTENVTFEAIILPRIRIFGRTKPDGKKRIVEHLQSNGKKVVAMCGDGGNDSAALRQAHVGVAMCTPAAPENEDETEQGGGAAETNNSTSGRVENKGEPDRNETTKIPAGAALQSTATTTNVSAVAPFVATDPSVYNSVVKLVIEGRACLENCVTIVLFFNIVGLSWCLGPKFLVQLVGAFMPMGFWFWVDALGFLGLPFAIAQLKPPVHGGVAMQRQPGTGTSLINPSAKFLHRHFLVTLLIWVTAQLLLYLVSHFACTRATGWLFGSEILQNHFYAPVQVFRDDFLGPADTLSRSHNFDSSSNAFWMQWMLISCCVLLNLGSQYREPFWKNKKFLLVFGLLSLPVLWSWSYPLIEATFDSSETASSRTTIVDQKGQEVGGDRTAFLQRRTNEQRLVQTQEAFAPVVHVSYLDSASTIPLGGLGREYGEENVQPKMKKVIIKTPNAARAGLSVFRGLNCVWNLNCDQTTYSAMWGSNFHGPAMNFPPLQKIPGAVVANVREEVAAFVSSNFLSQQSEKNSGKHVVGMLRSELQRIRLNYNAAQNEGANQDARWLDLEEANRDPLSKCADHCRRLWEVRATKNDFRCQYVLVHLKKGYNPSESVQEPTQRRALSCFFLDTFPTIHLKRHDERGMDVVPVANLVLHTDFVPSSGDGASSITHDLQVLSEIEIAVDKPGDTEAIFMFEPVRHNVLGRGNRGETKAYWHLMFVFLAGLFWGLAVFCTKWLKRSEDRNVLHFE